MKKICPACGSKNIERVEYDDIVESLGSIERVEKIAYICYDCSSEGDFFDENDVKIEKAIAEINSRAVNIFLNDLKEHGIK